MNKTATAIAPRPFLKWAGGKGRLLNQYQPFLPQHFSRYHEPFLGGGAVFFHLQHKAQQAILSDLNGELINVYQCVKTQVEALIACLEEHRSLHSPTYYYHVRQQQPEEAVARAARLIYLNKTCYNGLYRENSRGQFNVPVGRYKNPNICDGPLLRSAAMALQHCGLHHQPFEAVLETARGAADFVYFDPPYHPISATSRFTGYHRAGFSAQDQEHLAAVFRQLAARGVQVLLSNSDCDFIRNLYQGFFIQPVQVARVINAKARKRGPVTELLILSPALRDQWAIDADA